MKRFVAILMILLLLICAGGCSKDDKETPTDGSLTATTEMVVETETTHSQYEGTTTQKMVTVEENNEDQGEEIKEEINEDPNELVMIPDFTPICQLPEFPTGCEITSLTMVLRYYGYDVDKFDLADNFLEKGEVGSTNFYKAFVGSPGDGASYGCYAPVIEDTANKYLSSIGSHQKATAFSGIDFSTVLHYIDNSIPVIVWGTLDCRQGYQSITWSVDGEELTWITPEHCMVLVGYDDFFVYVADPMTGQILNYEMDLFIDCFRTLYSQVVVIE